MLRFFYLSPFLLLSSLSNAMPMHPTQLPRDSERHLAFGDPFRALFAPIDSTHTALKTHSRFSDNTQRRSLSSNDIHNQRNGIMRTAPRLVHSTSSPVLPGFSPDDVDSWRWTMPEDDNEFSRFEPQSMEISDEHLHQDSHRPSAVVSLSQEAKDTSSNVMSSVDPQLFSKVQYIRMMAYHLLDMSDDIEAKVQRGMSRSWSKNTNQGEASSSSRSQDTGVHVDQTTQRAIQLNLKNAQRMAVHISQILAVLNDDQDVDLEEASSMHRLNRRRARFYRTPSSDQEEEEVETQPQGTS